MNKIKYNIIFGLIILSHCNSKDTDCQRNKISQKENKTEKCTSDYMMQEILKNVFKSKIYSGISVINEKYVVDNRIISKGTAYYDGNGNKIKVVSKEYVQSGKIKNFVYIYKFVIENDKVHIELNWYLHQGVVLISKFDYSFNLENCEYKLEKFQQSEA